MFRAGGWVISPLQLLVKATGANDLNLQCPLITEQDRAMSAEQVANRAKARLDSPPAELSSSSLGEGDQVQLHLSRTLSCPRHSAEDPAAPPAAQPPLTPHTKPYPPRLD
jgi:hypothetical protein